MVVTGILFVVVAYLSSASSQVSPSCEVTKASRCCPFNLTTSGCVLQTNCPLNTYHNTTNTTCQISRDVILTGPVNKSLCLRHINTTGNINLTVQYNQICLLCHVDCVGCTGPSSVECLVCKYRNVSGECVPCGVDQKYDDAVKICVPLCTGNTTFDNVTETCVPICASNTKYDNVMGNCVPVCSGNAKYNHVTGKCNINATTGNTTGSSWDSQLWMIVGVSVGCFVAIVTTVALIVLCCVLKRRRLQGNEVLDNESTHPTDVTVEIVTKTPGDEVYENVTAMKDVGKGVVDQQEKMTRYTRDPTERLQELERERFDKRLALRAGVASGNYANQVTVDRHQQFTNDDATKRATTLPAKFGALDDGQELYSNQGAILNQNDWDNGVRESELLEINALPTPPVVPSNDPRYDRPNYPVPVGEQDIYDNRDAIDSHQAGYEDQEIYGNESVIQSQRVDDNQEIYGNTDVIQSRFINENQEIYGNNDVIQSQMDDNQDIYGNKDVIQSHARRGAPLWQ